MVETKPLNKLALIALREVERTANATVQEILAAAADVDAIDLTAGWGFDIKTGSWKRVVPDVAE